VRTRSAFVLINKSRDVTRKPRDAACFSIHTQWLFDCYLLRVPKEGGRNNPALITWGWTSGVVFDCVKADPSKSSEFYDSWQHQSKARDFLLVPSCNRVFILLRFIDIRLLYAENHFFSISHPYSGHNFRFSLVGRSVMCCLQRANTVGDHDTSTSRRDGRTNRRLAVAIPRST